MICDQLSLKSVSLFKLKSVHSFNNQLFKFKLTHIIYSDLLMKKNHWEITVSILIADLRQHNTILRKLWMNWNQLFLNMKNDSIVFKKDLFSVIKKTVMRCLSLSQHSISSSFSLSQSTLKVLSQSISTADDNLFYICSIKAASYTVLTHQKKVKLFTISMKNIDKQLTLDWECCAEKISIKHSISQHLKKIHQQLFFEYYKYLNVFDCF